MQNGDLKFNAMKFQSKEKALPIILLLDVSGSMSHDGKIEHLNEAVLDMLTEFNKEMTSSERIYKVAIVAFGTGAKVIEAFDNPGNILKRYQNLQADGWTYLGAALVEAKKMVENRDIIPSHWYCPAVVLLSDGIPEGEPTGYWEKCMNEFCNQGRSGKKTQRFAIALGAGADETILGMFTGNKDNVMHAEDATDILKCFREVTMTVSKRYDAPDPNKFVSYGNFNFDNANTSKPSVYSSRRKKQAKQNTDNDY